MESVFIVVDWAVMDAKLSIVYGVFIMTFGWEVALICTDYPITHFHEEIKCVCAWVRLHVHVHLIKSRHVYMNRVGWDDTCTSLAVDQ